MAVVNVGICGLGTVGGGAVTVLRRNAAVIAARAGADIVIRQIGARRDKPGIDTQGIDVVRDVFAVARNPDIDIVVELIGGTTTAKELVLEAIKHGKHVVTANKALIAEYGNEIFAAAAKQGVSVCFEAAVAGGIPIIKAIREGLAANRIQWLAGIINGTGNFILSEMRSKGRAFDDVLAEAQKLGYAEADPTFDVEGIDAAHKLVILASIAFGIPLRFDAVFTEGISRLQIEDIRHADELGYRVKHLGVARRTDAGVELRVHPTLIPAKRLIANVNGVKNAVLVESDAVGPTLYYGAGAGAEPTASAVIADIVDLARTMGMDVRYRVPPLAFQSGAIENVAVIPMEDVVCGHYLRMSVLDKPGVLSQVTQVLSSHGISVEALIQKEPEESAETATIILLTSRAAEKTLVAVVKSIEAMDSIEGQVVRLRVENLDG
ncbi:MAG: homoserine dehydrogenase [Gammaproteobacteria bacterium]|nr:MAG: homoserine dehydrogenase [Gammaproteobacteria bacterium]